MSPEFKVYTKDETRIIKKFLIFPRKIGSEIKWLKTAYIIQAYKSLGYDGDMWFDVCFVGQATYEHYKTTGQVLVTQEKIDQAWEDYCMR